MYDSDLRVYSEDYSNVDNVALRVSSEGVHVDDVDLRVYSDGVHVDDIALRVYSEGGHMDDVVLRVYSEGVHVHDFDLRVYSEGVHVDGATPAGMCHECYVDVSEDSGAQQVDLAAAVLLGRGTEHRQLQARTNHGFCCNLK